MQTLIDDLVKALEDEAKAHHSRYLEFSRQAEEGGHLQASKLFRAIVFAEKARVNLYCKSLASMARREELYDYYICPGCGYAQGTEAPEACPVCDTEGKSFEMIA